MPSKIVKRKTTTVRRRSKSPVTKAATLKVGATRVGRDGKMHIVRKKKTGKRSTGKYWAPKPKKKTRKSKTSKK